MESLLYFNMLHLVMTCFYRTYALIYTFSDSFYRKLLYDGSQNLT